MANNIETNIEDAATYRDENGKLHRTNGPAVIKDGYYGYWNHGKRHRLNGPAIIRANGDKFWYYKGDLMAISEGLAAHVNVKSYIDREIKIIPKHREDTFRLQRIEEQMEFEF